MEGPSGSDRARRALAFLRRRIASGEWPVNTRIPIESELMELMGVGKTTVREAVRSLASVGMLETLPGRGTFVRSRTPVSTVLTDYVSDFAVAELLVFRRALEVEAARQAALHRTEVQLAGLVAAHERDTGLDVDFPRGATPGRSPGQFHAVLFDASGNALLKALYAGVMASLRVAISRGEVAYFGGSDERRREHGDILAAVREQDAAAAARAMSAHADRDLVLTEPAPEPTGATAGTSHT